MSLSDVTATETLHPRDFAVRTFLSIHSLSETLISNIDVEKIKYQDRPIYRSLCGSLMRVSDKLRINVLPALYPDLVTLKVTVIVPYIAGSFIFQSVISHEQYKAFLDAVRLYARSLGINDPNFHDVDEFIVRQAGNPKDRLVLNDTTTSDDHTT